MQRGTTSTAPILVVEPDPLLRAWLTAALGSEGHRVIAVPARRDAEREAAGGSFAVALCDLALPDGDGLQFLRFLRQQRPDTAFILITEFGAVASATEALRLGAFDYLEKPLPSPKHLARAVRRALALSAHSEEPPAAGPRATPGLCGSMVARDPRMLHVLNLLGKVAPTACHVMLVGETGVGKEVIARCIHLHSRRAAQPFIAIRCSAAVPAAVESELFGHERGAVAGAVSRKLGALERAQAGTVFLDAVEELPLSIQARLLAALRDGRFLRSGGDQPVQTSARILSASTRDLEEDARSGRFHPDLLRLLGAFPIEIPPLRERPADIDALAEQFAGAAAVKFGKPQLRLSEAARFLLRSHPWPGNVRELENVIERAAILSDGEILPAHLPHVPPQAVSPAGAASLNVHELERKAIEEALRRHGGNRTRAARELGISLRTLQYRLKEYGLSKP